MQKASSIFYRVYQSLSCMDFVVDFHLQEATLFISMLRSFSKYIENSGYFNVFQHLKFRRESRFWAIYLV